MRNLDISKLITVRSQRIQLLLSFLISVLLLIPLNLQLNAEAVRSNVPQLDTANLSYCNLKNCPAISELGNLEVSGVEIVAKDQSTFVEITFVNPGRLVGEREFWLELKNPSGEVSEVSRATLNLKLKNPLILSFGFEQSPELLETGELRLAY